MRLGARLRALRRREGLTQAAFAERVGISTSYLNLIENDRRPLTAPVLIKLARAFDVDLAEFSDDAEDALRQDLMEAFGDPFFDEHGLTPLDLKALVGEQPEVARAVLRLYQAWRGSQERNAQLALHVSDVQDVTAPVRLPSEEVTDFLQEQHNHFPELEAAAERFWLRGDPEDHDLEGRLRDYLEHEAGVVVRIVKSETLRRFDPASRILHLSENLAPRSRNFQLAVQLALLQLDETLEGILAAGRFRAPAAHRLAKVTLASYFAGAVLMPYEPFLKAAREVRCDIEVLGNRFRTSFEQVAHRLTTLRRPGQEGVPFHFIRVDIAGNISKRFSASGIGFARFGSSCPKWNVFRAFRTPGRISRQISRMPDGKVYFCIARSMTRGSGGFHAPHNVLALGLGCRISHARELVYADGIDLEAPVNLVDIGVSCRLCPRQDCAWRAFPSLERPLDIDENTRGPSFYSPAS